MNQGQRPQFTEAQIQEAVALLERTNKAMEKVVTQALEYFDKPLLFDAPGNAQHTYNVIQAMSTATTLLQRMASAVQQSQATTQGGVNDHDLFG